MPKGQTIITHVFSHERKFRCELAARSWPCRRGPHAIFVGRRPVFYPAREVGPPQMIIFRRIKRAFQGDVGLTDLAREALRRRRAAARARAERASVGATNARPARLAPEFAEASPDELARHFNERSRPYYWREGLQDLRLAEVDNAIRTADRIVNDSTWQIAGFESMSFASENVWRRDPLTGIDWGLEYHGDVDPQRSDGSDIRVLWELNRLGHLIPLAVAFARTRDERYANTLYSHLESWVDQNPYGQGANWTCAMEVALRAINVAAAFDLVRTSEALNGVRIMSILRFFDQHGQFILDNNEFSHIATSNHYLSDVVGLFWVGALFPELANSDEWRRFGQTEMLREMGKQVQADGTDFEASTGYHKFVTELFLYSFRLAERNNIALDDAHRKKLDTMIDYLRAIRRPDGRIPMIGDCDGSQIVPVVKRDADEIDHLIGDGSGADSVAFPDAGAYVMRHEDLYLHFNASDCGIHGRGSHGHNDALSIEVSAFGTAFIVDPGSYVYNLDREARHLFRSTAYHSTVMIEGEEQNITNIETPFIIGNDAKPRVLQFQSSSENDVVSAEHYGYRRLPSSVIHRRTVTFEKNERTWIIQDEFSGEGEHRFETSFHLAPGISAVVESGMVRACDNVSGNSIVIAGSSAGTAELCPAYVSTNYGRRLPSTIVRWSATAECPARFDWTIKAVPSSERE